MAGGIECSYTCSAELNKSNLKFYGPLNKAFWACKGFSGIKFDSGADVHDSL